MSVCQLGDLKRKRGRLLAFPLAQGVLGAAIATGFIRDGTDLRCAVTRQVTRKIMVIEYTLYGVRYSRKGGPFSVLTRVFSLTFPYDPTLWIDTTYESD